jgi:hypothetical protein
MPLCGGCAADKPVAEAPDTPAASDDDEESLLSASDVSSARSEEVAPPPPQPEQHFLVGAVRCPQPRKPYGFHARCAAANARAGARNTPARARACHGAAWGIACASGRA